MQLTQREEQFFKAMAGNGSAPPPVSREERFMADIVSGESSGLSPLTAEERALNGLVGKIGGGGGGGDFSTAVVTMNVTEEIGAGTTEISNAVVVDDPVLSLMFPAPTRNMPPVTIVLYKGSSVIQISSHREVTAEGNIELDGGEDEGYWDYEATITGDCTINVKVGGLV